MNLLNNLKYTLFLIISIIVFISICRNKKSFYKIEKTLPSYVEFKEIYCRLKNKLSFIDDIFPNTTALDNHEGLGNTDYQNNPVIEKVTPSSLEGEDTTTSKDECPFSFADSSIKVSYPTEPVPANFDAKAYFKDIIMSGKMFEDLSSILALDDINILRRSENEHTLLANTPFKNHSEELWALVAVIKHLQKSLDAEKSFTDYEARLTFFLNVSSLDLSNKDSITKLLDQIRNGGGHWVSKMKMANGNTSRLQYEAETAKKRMHSSESSESSKSSKSSESSKSKHR